MELPTTELVEGFVVIVPASTTELATEEFCCRMLEYLNFMVSIHPLSKDRGIFETRFIKVELL